MRGENPLDDEGTTAGLEEWIVAAAHTGTGGAGYFKQTGGNADMETNFGRWLKSRSFQVFFFMILAASMAYTGLRIGNALEWGAGLRLYPHLLILFFLLFLLLFSLFAGNRTALMRGLKRMASYFLCFLLYNTLGLLLLDVLALLFDFPRKTRAWLVAAVALFTIILLLYGSIHARRFKTVHYTVKWGSRNGKARIVLLSDLHIGIFIGIPYLQRVVESVNLQKPDLVVISGDLFDGYLPDDQALCAIATVLQQLRTTYGVYAVNGNHDFFRADPRFQHFMQEAGIHFLCNNSIVLPMWNIVGRAGIVDMPGVRTPLPDLLQNIDPKKPVIVLDHDPQGIREATSCGVDLILCGHTHKGQFFPMTFFTKLANGSRYFYGYDIAGRTHSVISAGTGFFELPIRIGTDSEIVVIDTE